MEEDAINKISDGSKVNPEGERAEIQCCLMEENNIHSNTLISDEEMLERRDPPSEDTVDNICRDMKDFKIREEEKDFEDKKQKKRIKKSLHHLESQLIENRRIENERDFTSGAHITQTNELRTVENLGTLENLFTELEAEETEPVQLHGDINEVLCSDSEESIVNQTEVPSGKNSTESLQIKNMDQLRELIQNGIVGFGSHFRVRRRLGFYDYYHHFLTLETNDQSITVLHLTKTVPLYIFCEKAIVSFSNFNNTFFDFKCGVELIRWYSIPKNKTALEEINLRIEEVIALGYINYSLTSSDKMYCASLVSYILTGEKDYKEVHEFVRHYGVFGIFLVLLVNCFCSLISNIRCLKNSVSKLKQKFTYMFKVVKSKMLDKFYSFFSYLCCILDLAASYLERSIEKTFKERKRSNKKDDS
ncbi:uncharacterized protein LOC133193621 [Saccostrea echinata]|uniref:uncharacterized protein LOC133193621 n=1 Tax=Saccostrea echinata TaxID=191078 RepID=UPI002A8115F7|nr:uncharacterized protein LOC133193621 [Saccostrea echinata]